LGLSVVPQERRDPLNRHGSTFSVPARVRGPMVPGRPEDVPAAPRPTTTGYFFADHFGGGWAGPHTHPGWTASVPIPKFAGIRSDLRANFGIERTLATL